MIIGVRSISNGRYGLVDTITNKVVAPIEFKSLCFQKDGIVATSDNCFSTVYLTTGEPIVCNLKNPLFLNNNLILFSDSNNNCFIWNYLTKSYVCQNPFEAIMFFFGNNQQATMYSATTNLASILADPFYMQVGAYLENYVCARINKHWGVISLADGAIYEPFVHPVIVQCTNSRIAVRDLNGSTRML